MNRTINWILLVLGWGLTLAGLVIDARNPDSMKCLAVASVICLLIVAESHISK